MSRPAEICNGDCFHCPLPDCTSKNYASGRSTPFEREQSAIRQEKAARAKAEAARIKEIEDAFVAWKKRNGIIGYKNGGKRHGLP